ncbi:hypothetical protein J7M23_06600, partial [Candidatus Sumerlaeota bacterium]|nr:hypothetical protein [Candidatus Sumerlaeota bacterium]
MESKTLKSRKLKISFLFILVFSVYCSIWHFSSASFIKNSADASTGCPAFYTSSNNEVIIGATPTLEKCICFNGQNTSYPSDKPNSSETVSRLIHAKQDDDIAKKINVEKSKSDTSTNESFKIEQQLVSDATPNHSYPSTPRVIKVPSDFPSIQDAIDASVDGCEIIVSIGNYFENINLKGKNVILRSIEPTSHTVVTHTIIDGERSGPVVTFLGTESPDCVLAGFTITHGLASGGAGIDGNHTLATIQNNIICDNCAAGHSAYGGGLYVCDGVIQNNIISHNKCSYLDAGAWGGGLAFCNGVIRNNIIFNNTTSGLGGGLSYCAGEIENNVIWG